MQYSYLVMILIEKLKNKKKLRCLKFSFYDKILLYLVVVTTKFIQAFISRGIKCRLLILPLFYLLTY